jgi:hypothetical protein
VVNPSLQLSRARQEFPDRRLADVSGTLAQQLSVLAERIGNSRTVAIAVGSRGITDIVPIVSRVVEFVKSTGAEPFLVPAMGSHGGATAEGQVELLQSYGITEQGVGAPVRSSMDVVELPKGESPVPVFMDRNAWESDAVILINRIKPHTDYHADYESGLVKMGAIGLGKHRQALELHRHGVPGLKEMMPRTARAVLGSGKVAGGVAIVEDAFDRTMAIEVLPAEGIMAREPALLAMARENMPRLPLAEIDVLIVDWLGKDISGVGMDPNIIGRMSIRDEPEPQRPRIKSIMVRDLTEGSHGNALGIGLADVITRRLYDKIDFAAMYANVYTSTFLERAKVPVVADNDEEAFTFALRASWFAAQTEGKIVRIPDTLHLGTLYVSDAAAEALDADYRVEVDGEPVEQFGENRNLVDVF